MTEHPPTVKMGVVAPPPVPASEPTAPEIPAEDYEAVWRELTPVQADAVRVTAELLLRDPAELAVELFPHLYFPKG